MRTLIKLLPVLLLLIMVSCSSKTVNTAKKKLSEMAGEGVSKYVSSKLTSKNVCEADDIKLESEKLKVQVTEAIEKLLKVKSTDMAISNKSIGGDLAQMACRGILTKALLKLVASKYDQYPCTLKYFGMEMEGVADKVCAKIKL